MKTTREKMDTLDSAIEELEMARDACADAISDICEDLNGTDVALRLAQAEPDGNVPEGLRALHSELDASDFVADEDA